MSYPAKRRKGARKTALPSRLNVSVQCHDGTYHTTARKKSTSSTVGAHDAVRALAHALGYSKSADVRWLRTDDRQRQYFQIVELAS